MIVPALPPSCFVVHARVDIVTTALRRRMTDYDVAVIMGEASIRCTDDAWERE